MSDKHFIDSNIAIYGMDEASVKGRIALRLLAERSRSRLLDILFRRF
ncbi:MAG TPA: hypothetical protein VGM92_05205 [Candidatus Kapabacteria bacterium]